MDTEVISENLHYRKSELRNLNRTKELRILINTKKDLGIVVTKENLIAHCVNNWGVTRRKALEYIDSLFVELALPSQSN
jgi:hypothetical protein